ncbi:MAG: hypothetical protein KAV87_65650 [Desulfobacteraceae bacterium]|nr:hypothetical protein [Desulfobacteraceae bacterium]
MRTFYLILSVLLITCVSAQTIVVPNGNFELIYKPGTGIPGVISSGGWSQGVGPDCPIDQGLYEFIDTTTGDVADIPGWLGYDRDGWLGYDRDGWIALGGTYGRDETTGNLQGAISSQHNYNPDGLNCYVSNGGGWNNAAGGLIVSAASLGTADPGLTYTLSAFAVNGDGPAATPVVLDLLVDGIAATPDSTVDPVFDATWHEFSRTYSGLSAGEMTIVLGVGRGAEGGQTSFDNVTLFHSPEPLPKGYMTKLVQETETAVKELEPQEAIAFLEKKIAEYEKWRATNLSDIKLRDKHLSSDIYFLLARAKEAAGAPNRDVIAAYKQSVSQVLRWTNYVPAALLWLFENIPSEDYVNIVKQFVYNTNVLSYNTYHIAKHFESSGNWAAFEHFLDAMFSGVDFRGQATYAYAEVVAKALEKDGAWSGKFLEYCRSKPQMMEYLFRKHERAASRYIARKNFGKAAKIYRDILNQCGPNQEKAIYQFKL